MSEFLEILKESKEAFRDWCILNDNAYLPNNVFCWLMSEGKEFANRIHQFNEQEEGI